MRSPQIRSASNRPSNFSRPALLDDGVLQKDFYRAAVLHGTRVHHLVIAGQVRLGNQNGRFSHPRDFVQTARATPADDQITDGVDIGNVVEIILPVIEVVEESPLLRGEGFSRPLSVSAAASYSLGPALTGAVNDKQALAVLIRCGRASTMTG